MDTVIESISTPCEENNREENNVEKIGKQETKKVNLKRRRVIKKHVFVYAMLLVAILHFLVFYVYVNFDSFLIAFQDQHTGEWGLSNFKLFFNDILRGKDSEILLNLKNTMIYFFVGILNNFISFILAYYLYKKIPLHSVFRFIFVLPMIISSVALVAVYKNLVSSGGPVAALWERITGQVAPNFLYDARYATICIVAFVIWTGLGMNLIIYSGAMNRIPESVIESARLDGVTSFQEMWKIVMPIIAPTFGTTMLLACIGCFGASGPILLFTGGMYGTSTISYWMYEYVIVNQQFNYAAAFGLCLSVCSLPIVLLCNWLTNRLPDDVSY